jgi:hypothetical protein
VNTLKTKQMTVDGIEANRVIIEELTYHDKPLPIDPKSESVRSPNSIRLQEYQTVKVIPSPEARELIRNLIYEPPSPILLEGLEEVKGLLNLDWVVRI